MYGLINKALRTMIIDSAGEQVWSQILDKSGVSENVFISMERYDDAVTYALAGAASEVLGASVEDCLETFGHYWATVTAPQAYGTLMDATGSDLIEFLENVNSLHDRITSTFIGYIPPYFEVHRDGKSVLLHYESQRQGLTPFVVGLVKGLAERFSCNVEFGQIELLSVKDGTHSVIPIVIS